MTDFLPMGLLRHAQIDEQTYTLATIFVIFFLVLLIANMLMLLYCKLLSARNLMPYKDAQLLIRSAFACKPSSPKGVWVTSEPIISVQWTLWYLKVSEKSLHALSKDELTFLLSSELNLRNLRYPKPIRFYTYYFVCVISILISNILFRGYAISLTPLILILGYAILGYDNNRLSAGYPEADAMTIAQTANPDAARSALTKIRDGLEARSHPQRLSAEVRLAALDGVSSTSYNPQSV